MKKFLSAILFLMFAGVASAQCIDLETTPIPGNCYSDAQLKVEAKPVTPKPAICPDPSGAGYFVQLKGYGTDSGLQKMSGVNPAQYTFVNLEPGEYEVIVRDQKNGTLDIKKVTVTSNYKIMNIQNLQALAPVCGKSNGGVKFQIPNGGIGPFEVTLFDMNDQVLLPTQTFQRPAGNGYIEVRGSNAHKILQNTLIKVQIKDVTDVHGNCGEIRRFPSVQIPSETFSFDCVEIKTADRYLYRSETDCNAYRLRFRFHDKNGVWLDRYIDRQVLKDHFSKPGTAVVRFLNRSKTVDISSSFDVNAFYLTTNGYDIQKGDEIEITVKGPNNTIVERVKFNDDILTPSCPSSSVLYTVNQSYKRHKAGTCGTIEQQLVFSYGVYQSAYKNFPNTGGGGTYQYHIDWPVAKFNITQFKLEKSNSDAGPWTTVQMVIGPAGSGQARWGSGYIGVDQVGEGYYRLTYTDPIGCRKVCTSVVHVFYKVQTTTNPLDNIWKDVRIGYGAYEGTGAYGIYFTGNNFYLPLKFKVEPTDGTKSVTYQGSIGWSNTVTRTITYPLEMTVNSTGNVQQGYTNLPTGEYKITVTDACGNTSTRNYFLPAMHYTPELKYERDCEVGKIMYDLGRPYMKNSTFEAVYLEKYEEDGHGGGSWKPVKVNGNNNYIYGHKGTFSNLLPAKYRLYTNLSGSYRNRAFLRDTGGNYNNFYDLTDPTTPNVGNTVAYGEITIGDLVKINPILNPAVCNNGSNSGMISVDLTGQQVFFPVTYELYSKPNATSTQTTFIEKATYQQSQNQYYHIFRNLPTGHYMVRTIHRCQTVNKDIEIGISGDFDPYLVVDRPAPFCKGNTATVYLGVSEHIFDIRWFKLDANGQKTTSSPLQTGSSFSEAIYTTTHYLAEYNLKPGIGCGNAKVYTKSVTVTMPPEDEDPLLRTPCPNDIIVFADQGACGKSVNWREPSAYNTCNGAITTVKSHTPPYYFNIGVHTVTYTFSDVKGNTTSCSFTVTVKSNATKLKSSHRYTDTSGNTITQLTPNQEFFYVLNYQNDGSENINKATINIKLPANTTVVTNGNPDLNGAGDGTVNNPHPQSSYNNATKSYQFVIGGTAGGVQLQSTLKAGDPVRTIRIPLKLVGNCDELLKPCENYLHTAMNIEYEGGPSGCTGIHQKEAGVKTITVDTSGCNRQEVFCGTGAMTFKAVGGFTSYQWYKDGNLLPGETKQSIVANSPGVYKVEKTSFCEGVSVVTVETISYQGISPTTDPIRAQAQNIGVTCPGDGSWTSHFYFCQGGSKNITVSYKSTAFEWQQWSGGCTETSPDCRNTDDNCWNPIHSNATFTANSAGKYRLHLKDCNENFYFEVFTAGLSGNLTDKIDETNYSQGSVRLTLSTSGVNYKVEIYKGGLHYRTDNINTNDYRIPNLPQGTYDIKVTSVQIPGCEYNGNVTIDKLTEMTMTAAFKGWKDCNTAKLQLKAEGGKPTYRFYIWSINGVQQFADEQTAIASTSPIALQLGHQTNVDVDVPNITQVGEYVFIVGDMDNGKFALSNKVTITPPDPHSYTLSVTQEIECESNPNSGHINMIFPSGSQHQNRTINLYKLDSNGNRITPAFKTSSGGLFTGLPAGSYEIEMKSNVGGNICTYSQKPIVIAPTKDPLRAFAGVVADKDCDASNQYKIAVNNVTGGTPPYRYSFDGETTYGTNNIGFMGGSGNVYVKDSKDCRIVIPVNIVAQTIPTLTIASPITYRCDNGYGMVTVTIASTTSQTYEYSIDGSGKTAIAGNTFSRWLAPGTHSITVYYKTLNTATTPNVLYVEDFGKGANECLSGATTGLVCKTDGNLADGNYVVTKQVGTNASWVPSPTDPSGGRYLAIAGNGNNEVVYEKRITGATTLTPITISFDALNLISSASGVAPRFSVELHKNDGTLLRGKNVGTVNATSWKNVSVTFTEAELTGLTNGTLIVKIVNTAAASYGNLGNDYAVDNIKVAQATQYCASQVSQLVNIEKFKQMRIEKYGAEKNVSCKGASDGQVRIRVINPASNTVKYSIDPHQAVWTTTTLDAQGVFTITGLSATQNGVVAVQDANNPNCITTLQTGYKIGEPTSIVPAAVVMEKITCYNGGKAKIKVSATGGTPGYQYQVGLVTGTLSAPQPAAKTPNPYEFNNLVAGTYSLVVTDANGCKTETTFEIEDKATISATAEPQSYCYRTGDEKKVVITMLSGNGNYKVQRVGGAIYSFNTNSYVYPDALPAGNHTFVITDAFGCSTTVTTQVYDPLTLQVSPTTQQYADCKGGSVTYTLTAQGGIPTAMKEFKYSVDNGVTYTTIATAPSQATVAVSVATTTVIRFQVTYKPDGSECTAERYITLLSDSPRFLKPFTTTKATCGKANGSVTITPSDYYVGTASYTLVIKDTGGAVQSATALAQGNYIAELTDNRGCVASQTFTIGAVPQLTATATVTKQMGCTSAAADLAAITVTLVNGGGTPPFTVHLRNNLNGYESTHTLTASNNMPTEFTGLDYGNYDITITDANSCETKLSTVINPNSNVMSITAETPTSCTTTSSMVIKASNGTTFSATTNAYFAVYRPGIVNPPNTTTAQQLTTANLNGGTDTWYKGTASGTGVAVKIPNLTPGVQYTFVVYNITTGCRYTQQATMPVPTYSTLGATLQVANVKCAGGNDGTVSYTLTGFQGSTTAITWKIFREDNHQQVGAGGSVTAPFHITQNTNSNLPAGKYYIEFTENTGCVKAFPFEIKRSAVPLQVSTMATQKASCSTLGQAWLNIKGGTASYTYGYVTAGGAYNPAAMTGTTQASTYINLPAGNWDVYVSDAYGCIQHATVTIGMFDVPRISDVTALNCQAYNNITGKIPVRVTLNQIGQGNHYYTLDGSADQPVVWTIANQAFEVEVSPLVNHTIVVKDVNGCATSTTFSTTAIITATATVSKVKTCATPTAEITVVATGGTGVYSYTLERLDNGSLAGEIIRENVALPAGGVVTITNPTEAATYRISIFDAETRDCPIVKEVQVVDPTPIDPSTIVAQAYNEKCNLGLTATPTGSIDVAIPTDPDTYTFRITSAIDLTDGSNLTVTTTPSTAGTHNATFTQLRGTTQGVRYQITVTNSTGCTAMVETILTSPEPLSFDADVLSATQYVCEGGAGMTTPKVSVDVTKIRGGIPPYTTEFFDGVGNSLGTGTEYTLTNLNGGSFYVSIKDASGTCSTNTASVTVAPAFALTSMSITTTTSVTCVVDEVINISLTVTPTYIAGTPLRYTIRGTDNGFVAITSTTATTLSVPLTGSSGFGNSNYTIEVINERTGCSITGVHSIRQPNTFAIESTNPVRAVCHNDNGSITLGLVDTDLSNGDQSTNGYTYTITSVGATVATSTSATIPAGTRSFTVNLKGGSYDIEVTVNGVGCKVPKTRFTIPSNPAEIEVRDARQKVSVDCANKNGVAALTVVGGQETFTVTLTPVGGGTPHVQTNVRAGAPGIEFGGLDAGSYIISVTDALGCATATGTLSVTIDPYSGINTSTISVTTTPITCIDADNGTLKVTGVTGGARPYHYILVRTSAMGSDLPEIATNEGEATFTGIKPGTYRVDIVDAKNCSVTVAGSYTFTNPQPITADIDVTNSTFFTCYGENGGSVTVHNIAGGTGSYTVNIVRADNNQKIDGRSGVTAGSSETFSGLAPSPKNTYYQVVIQDTNKCTMTKTLSFTVEEFPDIAISYVEQEGTCEMNTNNYVDHLIVRFRNTEVDYSKITYSLNGTASRTAFTRTVGNIAYIDNFDRTTRTQTIHIHYTAVAPITGYCTTSKTFTVDQITPLVLSQVTNTTLNTIEVIATGGVTSTVKGYTYYFNGVDSGDNRVYKIKHNDPERIDNGRRIKIIEVKVEDAQGCVRTMTIEKEYLDIEVPNFFTPDGDGINDVWKPKNLDNNVNARFYIFDRYGRRVALLRSGEGWDGNYDGRSLPAGDYWYIIEVNDELYDKREFYGNFTLYR